MRGPARTRLLLHGRTEASRSKAPTVKNSLGNVLARRVHTQIANFSGTEAGGAEKYDV